MDERIIDELLLQLEQSLNNVESARQQVEKTVNAYEALRQVIEHYTQDLGFIVQNTRTMISQLEEIKEKFLGNISVAIIEEIKAAVREITEHVDALSLQITAVCDLINSKSLTIISDINNRADSIDLALRTIQTTIENLSDKTNGIITKLDGINTTLNNLTLNEENHFKEIRIKLEAQDKFISRELFALRKQNVILFAINVVLLLTILGFVLHMTGVL